MSSGHQRYQGYPYVNPIVTDAPSLDPVTASRWNNLPRKVLSPSTPGPSGSIPSRIENNLASSTNPQPIPPKQDLDANPVVYIDFPEPDGSDVCQSIEAPEDVEPEYVQDTILYNPFDNKRITPGEDSPGQSSASDTPSVSSSPVYDRPNRPNTLDLMGAGTSSTQSPLSSHRPGLPPSMEKEAFVYGGQGDDGFPLSPIPMSEFPEPPPAYTEIAVPSNPEVQRPPVPLPTPPRTEVILPNLDPVHRVVGDRKYLTCHHCGARGHTLVIKETGKITYLIGFILFLFVMPFFIIVYFCDCFKHKNHYCPNCNKMIGYVLPIFGKKVHFKHRDDNHLSLPVNMDAVKDPKRREQYSFGIRLTKKSIEAKSAKVAYLLKTLFVISFFFLKRLTH